MPDGKVRNGYDQIRKKRKIHAIESGIVDRIPPPKNTRKARNSKGFRAKSLAGAEGFGLAYRLGQFAHERHWRSLTPRHAVLEWMWEKHEQT